MDRDQAQGPGGGSVSILRDYGIGHQALAKILANPEPPGYQMSEIRRKPVIGPHLATIDQILADDKEAPPKQRHSARRIFERLRDEHGYAGCYSQVQTTVQRAKHYSKEAFVPLSHPPGHSQFDFGEAVVEIAGARTKAHLGVITLPYSDTYFLSAYPRECTETFQAAHVAGFEFFGGVPLRISYDNTTIAVSKIIGTERELTRGFLTLESHHLFEHHFCHVGRGMSAATFDGHEGDEIVEHEMGQLVLTLDGARYSRCRNRLTSGRASSEVQPAGLAVRVRGEESPASQDGNDAPGR